LDAEQLREKIKGIERHRETGFWRLC
jgi:hypothetical protein